LRFFVEHRQKDWLEWLASAEFAVSNKVHIATKVLPFMENYGREMRMGEDIRKSRKVEKATEFMKRIKRVHEEVRAVLKKTQEVMKRQADKGRKETEDWKKGDRVILSTKDLLFKERPVKKLVDRYVGLYTIEEVVSTNAVKLRLPALMRIHPVVNISQIVRYKEQVKRQKRKEGKPMEVDGVEEWEVEKILNKKKIRGVEKYLVCWKRFMVEHDTWERREDLGNAKEVLQEFEGRVDAEVRKQEKINSVEEQNFRRGELPERFTAKMLYGWDDGKFEEKYLKKLERNWKRWKAASPEEKP